VRGNTLGSFRRARDKAARLAPGGL